MSSSRRVRKIPKVKCSLHLSDHTLRWKPREGSRLWEQLQLLSCLVNVETDGLLECFQLNIHHSIAVSGVTFSMTKFSPNWRKHYNMSAMTSFYSISTFCIQFLVQMKSPSLSYCEVTGPQPWSKFRPCSPEHASTCQKDPNLSVLGSLWDRVFGQSNQNWLHAQSGIDSRAEGFPLGAVLSLSTKQTCCTGSARTFFGTWSCLCSAGTQQSLRSRWPDMSSIHHVPPILPRPTVFRVESTRKPSLQHWNPNTFPTHYNPCITSLNSESAL